MENSMQCLGMFLLLLMMMYGLALLGVMVMQHACFGSGYILG
jgi:hypothetical protein